MKKVIFIIVFFIISTISAYSEIKISNISGRVQVFLNSQQKKRWITPDFDTKIFEKDKIRTGKNSSITLKSKSYEIILLEKSILLLNNIYQDNNKNLTVLYVLKGKVRVKNDELNTDEKIRILTKNSEISPDGTDLVVDFNGINNTAVYVFDGKAKVLNPNKPSNVVDLKSYEMSTIKNKKQPAKPENIPDKILKEYNVPPKPALMQPGIKEPVKPEIKPEPEKKLAVKEPKPEKPKKKKKKPKPEKKEKKKPEEKKEPWCKDPTLKFRINFNIMYTEFNKTGHIMLALMPELIYCKIGVGFYFPIYYNYKYNFLKPKESWYNHDEWDFKSPSDSAHDLWIKFVYIRYGKKGDPLFIRIGGLRAVTIANGFIMNDYSNMLNFPKKRKLGLQFDFIYNKFIGFETIFGDLNILRLYGGRFLIFPLWFNPNLGLLNKLQMGVTLIYDKIEERKKVINWGLDVGLPIVESKIFNLRYGIDYAVFSVKAPDDLNKNGWISSDNYGFSTGFKGNLSILIFRAEYRYLENGYICEYFDSFYDLTRKSKYDELINMYKKVNISTWNGYLANIGFRLGKVGEIGGVYQEYYSDSNKTANKAKVYLTLERGVISKFYGTAAYHKVNIVGLTGRKSLFGNLYDPNTMLAFDGGIAVLPFTYITLSYRKSFEYDENGDLKTYETYSTGLSIGF